MNTPPPDKGFDIISTIRSDGILESSQENISINAHTGSTARKLPCQFYMLAYHQERMLASAKAFGRDTHELEGPEGFNRLLLLLQDHLQFKYNHRIYRPPLMLRIAFSADGRLSVTSNGPHPWPATIDRLPSLPFMNSVSQLYPKSLSTIADPFPNLQYLRPYLHWCVFITVDKRTPSLFTRHKTSNRFEYDKALARLPASPPPIVINGIQLQIEILIVNDRWEIMEGCRFTPYFRSGDKWITPAAHCGGNLGTTRRWALSKGLCEEGVVQGGSVKDNDIIVLSNGAKGFQAGIVRPWSTLFSPPPLPPKL